MRKQAILLALASITVAAAAAAETITYQYDARGRLVKVARQSSAGTTTTNYSHDKANNRTSKTVSGAP